MSTHPINTPLTIGTRTPVGLTIALSLCTFVAQAQPTPPIPDHLERDQALYQAQAKAVVSSTKSPGTASGQIKELLDSPAIERETAKQAGLNNQASNAVTLSVIDKIKSQMPRLTDLGAQIKGGKHVIVSKNGEEIIALIRDLASSTPQNQDALFQRLKLHVDNRSPEAMNFMGFVAEAGILGATKDMARATSYYQAAAQSNYLPAIYNLALVAAYGRNGRSDQPKAIELLRQGLAIEPDSSYRVCGMASFLAFRQGQYTAAHQFSNFCPSPLANFSLATYDLQAAPLAKKVSMLRLTLQTGVDDAFSLIEQIATPSAATDANFTMCKYRILNEYRMHPRTVNVSAQAQKCVQPLGAYAQKTPAVQTQILAGVVGFSPTELAQIQQMRNSNHFHYDWPAPFLPFAQQEVNLFEPIMPKAKQ